MNPRGLASKVYAGLRSAADNPRARTVASMFLAAGIGVAARRYPALRLGGMALTLAEKSGRRLGGPTGAFARRLAQQAWMRWGGSGGAAQFTYRDVHGNVTERMVRNWKSTGRVVTGFCVRRNAMRSFRIDRIKGWVEVE